MPMKKHVVLYFIVVSIFFPQVSVSLNQKTIKENDLFTIPPLKADVEPKHKVMFGWTIPEVGFPLMPRMTNYWGTGFQAGRRISYNSNTILQVYFKMGLYGVSNEKLTHTMMFDNTPTEVVVLYHNSLTQFGIGYRKTAATDRFFRPFMEANLGLAKITNKVTFPDYEPDNSAGHPGLQILIHKDWGGLFNVGGGIEFGKYNSNGAYMLGVSYSRSFRPMKYIHPKFMELEPRPTSQSGGTDLYADFIDVLLFPSNVYNHKVGEIYSSHLQFFNINLTLFLKL